MNMYASMNELICNKLFYIFYNKIGVSDRGRTSGFGEHGGSGDRYSGFGAPGSMTENLGSPASMVGGHGFRIVILQRSCRRHRCLCPTSCSRPREGLDSWQHNKVIFTSPLHIH